MRLIYLPAALLINRTQGECLSDFRLPSLRDCKIAMRSLSMMDTLPAYALCQLAKVQ
jgi:hypothetical protein